MFLDTLDKLMSERGLNRSTLAKESGIPYTTIDGFYKKGCDNIKLSTLIRLASFFNVTLDYLISESDTVFTAHEKKIIFAYRNKPEMRKAVDRILGIDSQNE